MGDTRALHRNLSSETKTWSECMLDTALANQIGMETVVFRYGPTLPIEITIFRNYEEAELAEHDLMAASGRAETCDRSMFELGDIRTCWLETTLKLASVLKVGTRRMDYVSVEALAKLIERGTIHELYACLRILMTDVDWEDSTKLENAKHEFASLVHAFDGAQVQPVLEEGEYNDIIDVWDLVLRDQPSCAFTYAWATRCPSCEHIQLVETGNTKDMIQRSAVCPFDYGMLSLTARYGRMTTQDMATIPFRGFLHPDDGKCAQPGCAQGRIRRLAVLLDRFPPHLMVATRTQAKFEDLGPSKFVVEYYAYDRTSSQFHSKMASFGTAGMVLMEPDHFLCCWPEEPVREVRLEDSAVWKKANSRRPRKGFSRVRSTKISDIKKEVEPGSIVIINAVVFSIVA